jgi:adenosylhomocysteinase
VADIPDLPLAKQGELSYNWASSHMTILQQIRKKKKNEKSLSGLKLGLCLHITKETSVLVMVLKSLGAEIAICSANPLSVQDDIAAFLSSEGARVFAWRGETKEEYNECIRSILNYHPDIITDDGSDLHVAAHKAKAKGVRGGTEETTSGVMRLKALESKKQLSYPIIAVNNAFTKFLFDNRYGTGQSTIDGVIRATGLFLAGKQVIVCGYGWVGKGVAVRAKGMGAIVTITEIDPIKALEAHMDGFDVKRLSDVAAIGDIFITCTGQTHVIRREHFLKMKNNSILANAGHFDEEIDIWYLKSQDSSPTTIRPNVECYNVLNKRVFLLCKGRVVNLVGAEGHPSEVMDLSFANQLLSILHISKNYLKMDNIVYDVPTRIDSTVANYALDAMNIEIDTMTDEQRKYINNLD